MRQDPIARIEIDATGRLHVTPVSASLPYVWREALEVHWDPDRRSLSAPPPRQWSRARWFRQILNAAETQGLDLRVTEATEWIGVEPDDRVEMVREVRS